MWKELENISLEDLDGDGKILKWILGRYDGMDEASSRSSQMASYSITGVEKSDHSTAALVS